MARILEWKPLRWIGVLSYSLYVWQQLFLMWRPVPQLAWMTHLPVNIVFVFAFGCASYWLVERPALRWARRSGAAAEDNATTPAIKGRASTPHPVSTRKKVREPKLVGALVQ